MKISVENFADKFKEAKMTKKGNSTKIMAALALTFAMGGLSNTVEASNNFEVSNGFEPQVEQSVESPEILKLKEEKQEFNASYLEKDQENIINVGYFIGEKLGLETSDLSSVIDITENNYYNYINVKNISQNDFDITDYAETIKAEHNIEEAPNFLLSSVDSPYTDFEDLSPEMRNSVSAKAFKLIGEDGDLPSSAEEAYDFVKDVGMKNMRWNGGVWNGEDVTFEQNAVKSFMKDLSTKGITAEDINELPNYLYENPENSIDSSNSFNQKNMNENKSSPNKLKFI